MVTPTKISEIISKIESNHFAKNPIQSYKNYNDYYDALLKNNLQTEIVDTLISNLENLETSITAIKDVVDGRVTTVIQWFSNYLKLVIGTAELLGHAKDDTQSYNIYQNLFAAVGKIVWVRANLKIVKPNAIATDSFSIEALIQSIALYFKVQRKAFFEFAEKLQNGVSSKGIKRKEQLISPKVSVKLFKPMKSNDNNNAGFKDENDLQKIFDCISQNDMETSLKLVTVNPALMTQYNSDNLTPATWAKKQNKQEFLDMFYSIEEKINTDETSYAEYAEKNKAELPAQWFLSAIYFNQEKYIKFLTKEINWQSLSGTTSMLFMCACIEANNLPLLQLVHHMMEQYNLCAVNDKKTTISNHKFFSGATLMEVAESLSNEEIYNYLLENNFASNFAPGK